MLGLFLKKELKFERPKEQQIRVNGLKSELDHSD